MTTATVNEDRVVTRLAAITAILTDPGHRGPYWHRWEARAAQLAERPDPVIAPPAGTWMRGSRPGDVWHVSSGIAEQSFHGACRSWFTIVPACNRRYEIQVAIPEPEPVEHPDTRTVTVGTPRSPRCERCKAIEAGTAKPANWQETVS